MSRSAIAALRAAACGVAIFLAAPGVARVFAGEIETLAFGSCLQQSRPQPIWDAVLNQKPDAFVFLGDNIYADTTDALERRREYGKLGAQPGFRRLRASCAVFATWDDHDYGATDAGAEFPAKEESKDTMLDFFNEPPDSERRGRPGVYESYLLGEGDRRVQLILLDTRTFRSALRKAGEGKTSWNNPYLPSVEEGATMLGADQWQWLERTLREPAAVRIVASSVQVIPDEHPFEKWGNFPAERARLLELLSRASGAAVILSGDRHMAELSRLDINERALYELTSSGMNAGMYDRADEPNRHRVLKDVFLEHNFGAVRINWKRRTLTFEIRDEKGRPVKEHRVRFSEIAAPAVV